jgi:hypothetical protein
MACPVRAPAAGEDRAFLIGRAANWHAVSNGGNENLFCITTSWPRCGESTIFNRIVKGRSSSRLILTSRRR